MYVSRNRDIRWYNQDMGRGFVGMTDHHIYFLNVKVTAWPAGWFFEFMCKNMGHEEWLIARVLIHIGIVGAQSPILFRALS